MRNLMLALGAAAMVAPVAMAAPPTAAEASPQKRYKYKEWRGRDGRTYCRKSDGTTGLIIGAAGGALIGRAIDTRGDRALGTIGGAAAGALLGREVERSRSTRRCR